MQGMMVWVSSVWPTLRAWCIMFRIWEPPIFIAHAWSESSFSINLIIYFSSFTGATNARNEGMSVISLTYSTCLVQMFRIWEPPIFHIYQGYKPWSESDFCSFSINLIIYFSSFTGATNARNDVISVTYSTCLVHNIMFRIWEPHIPRLYIADMVRERFLFIFYQLESSFTEATNARNDGMSVISLTTLRAWCIMFQTSEFS